MNSNCWILKYHQSLFKLWSASFSISRLLTLDIFFFSFKFFFFCILKKEKMYLKWTRNFIIRLCLLVYSSSSKRGRDWAAVFHHHHHYGRHSWARARTRSRERWSSSNGVVAAAILPWQFQLFFFFFNSLSFVFYVSSPSSQSPFCVVLFHFIGEEDFVTLLFVYVQWCFVFT